MKTNKAKPFVLVLMPFAADYDDVYKLGIKPACEAVGAVCERVDEQAYQSAIIHRIYEQIERADLVVADLSNRNLNVYYETGYAHALGKKVILLTRPGEKMPFDIGNYPHVLYERDKIADLREKLEWHARQLLDQPPARQPALKAAGIERVYPSRLDALPALEEAANDENTDHIYIVGISLRDFLTEHGKLRPAWEAIRARLEREQKGADAPAQTRLRVRLLLLDPQSHEGFFRYKVEKQVLIEEGGKIRAADIDGAEAEIKTVRGFYRGEPQDYFAARFYGHCPFSFVLVTNRAVFTEQYFYKTNDQAKPLPLVEYAAGSRPYKQLRDSFDIIWEHARASRLDLGAVAPVERARIENIYRVDNRPDQSARQVESIRRVEAGGVDILAITGGKYTDNNEACRALKAVSSKEPPVVVRFALLNPVCQQAIFRAVADKYGAHRRAGRTLRDALESYDWERHKMSNIYSKVSRSVHEVDDARRDGYAMDLRLYSCSTTHSYLITPESAFVGTYVYGRSERFQHASTLVSEYPLIEYRLGSHTEADKTEEELIRCTFDIIWNYYSITIEDYLTRVEPRAKEEFEKNLARVREELALPPRA